MKGKVKYGHELLDIEIPEGTDLSILLPKQHPTGVRSEEEIVEDALAHPLGPGCWPRRSTPVIPCASLPMTSPA